MGHKLRVGLVGTGFGVRVHLPGFSRCDEIEVVAVASAQLQRAEAAASAWGIPFATDDYRELLARDDIDLIDVCTPPESHQEITMAAIAAGKHVLCEKPFAPRTEAAAEMVAAAERAGIVHALVHEMRYDPVRRFMRRLVAEGYLGTPQFVVAAVHADHGTNPAQEPYYWGWAVLADTGGGFVMSSLSHQLDLLQFTFGAFDAVHATPATLIREKPVLTFEYRDGDPIGPETPTIGMRPVDADDTVVMHGSFASGALLSLSGSWSLRFPVGTRVEAYGDEGTLRLESSGILLGARRGDSAMQPLEVPASLALDPVNGEHRLTPNFSALAREVAATVRGEPPKEAVMASFADGYRLQRVLDQARGIAVAPS